MAEINPMLAMLKLGSKKKAKSVKPVTAQSPSEKNPFQKQQMKGPVKPKLGNKLVSDTDVDGD